mgnify:CR=1 FL=1
MASNCAHSTQGYTYESVKKVLLDKFEYQLNKQVDAVKTAAKNHETIEELRKMLHADWLITFTGCSINVRC